MKKLIRSLGLAIGLAALLGLVPAAQAQYNYDIFIHAASGSAGLAGVTGVVAYNFDVNFGLFSLNSSGALPYTTDANGNARVSFGGVVYSVYHPVITFVVSATPPAPYVLTSTGQAIDVGANGSGTVNFSARSGTLSGGVLVYGSIGLPGVTVTGSAGNSGVTDANGFFNLGTGPDQVITVAKSGVTFDPSAVVIAPNFPLYIKVVSGPFSGRVTSSPTPGLNVSGVTLTVSRYRSQDPGCAVQTDSSGNYTTCVIDTAGSGAILTPSKTGYHFTPSSYSYGNNNLAPGMSGMNFAMASTPPAFATGNATLNANENTPPLTNLVAVNYGDMPAANVSLTVVSSNTNLIPNTAASLFLQGALGSQSLVVVLIPGAFGTSVITLTLNDGINAAVQKSVTVNVAQQPQAPVVGMPVALNLNGANNSLVIPGFGSNLPPAEITVEFWQWASPNNKTTPNSTMILTPDNVQNRFNIHAPWADNTLNGTIYWDYGDITGPGRLAYALPFDITGKWTHLAFVSSQSANGGVGAMQMYINGSLVQQKSGASTFTSPVKVKDLVMGGGISGFGGALSELRIWKTARTATQILQNMNNPLVGNETNLLAYYRFNENSGMTIHSSTTNNINSGGIRGDAPYPAWVAAQTNFNRYFFRSFSTNNLLYLPGYIQDKAQSTLVWTVPATNIVNGTLTQVQGGLWSYTPSPTFTGGDVSFVYLESSGAGTPTNAGITYIHVAPLAPPVLSPIANQLVEESTATPPILFTVFDTNTPVSQLSLSIVSDNPALLDPAIGFTLTTVSNSGNTNMTMALVITPKPGAIGSANITLSASDAHNLVTESFIFQVNQKPAYTIVDLGLLPGRYASYGAAINNNGQVVGYATDGSAAQNSKLAFLYTGFDGGGQTIALATNSSLASAAFGINGAGQITGSVQGPDGNLHVFFYDTYGAATLQNLGALGTNAGSGLSTSVGLGINDSGVVVGDSFTSTAGQVHAIKTGAGLVDLGLAGTNIVAASINNAGQIVGYAVNNGVTNAFVISPVATNNYPASTNFLGFLPGGGSSAANAINSFGDVVGFGGISGGYVHAFLAASSGGGLVDLGTLPGFTNSVAYGLNGFRQVVGSVTGVGGVTHAFLYTTGKINDLNNLIPYEETNSWNLTEARGINDSGAIVGTGRLNGVNHAFLALPARVIGKPVPRPLGTVAIAPAIDVIQPQGGSATAFYWSVPDSQLYAISPSVARIHWATGQGLNSNPTNPPATVDVTSKSVWPRVAQTHVANVPVQVEPQGAPAGTFNYSFSTIMYSTNTGAGVDPNSKVFTALGAGYTVLRYLQMSPGVPLDQINSPSYFQVVRTVNWNDPYYLTDNVAATIGTTITNTTHFDYSRNGYVYFSKSVYDGVPADANRAYDRPTRLGTIIPVNLVNKNLTVPDDDLVVVWYHTNAIGAAWADSPYRYVPRWPTSMDPTNIIVIASQQGSSVNGQNLPATYLNPQPYIQNNPALPGFNPNEEHARFIAGTLYALRCDLNSLYGNLSQPYALLKYQDAAIPGQPWTMRAFQVVASTPQFPFVYSGTAGTEIQPPKPVSLLQLCTDNNLGVSGPFYKAAVNGHLYARAAGPQGQHTNVVLRYWYPLQPDFYYPGALAGTCVPWLDNGTGVPQDITYDISWPTKYLMQVGQTLTTAALGLPDITDLLNAKIIYDDVNPTGTSITNSARLYDPFSARSLPVDPTAPWLTAFKTKNVNGVVQFTDLPWYLRIRLTFDPINNLLSFTGQMPVPSAGAEPILLPNVMSLREREAIKQLLEGSAYNNTSAFDTVINQLYDLTRNPNRLKLNPPGVDPVNYDYSLLIGLTAVAVTNNQVVSTNIVPQTFGSQAKALTTGLFGVPPAQAVPPGSTNYPPRYVTVVQDDPTTPGSTVQMYVIQVDQGPFGGALAPLPGDNVFDQRLTLRYTPDFGGDPSQLQFQWLYFAGANGGVSPTLPTVDASGNIVNYNGWLVYQPPDVTGQTLGFGANDITLGLGGQSGLLTMSDNWFISRYQGYGIDGRTNWSAWVGQPGGGAATLAVGWINRVLAGLNPFEARSTDFHTSPINTYQTMLEQAGPRYEGPIALNSDPNYINSVGLIDAYQTVLEVGESLSINGTPPVNYEPANQTLLNAASRISDFYVLLGNEAYAEASDPTIGFSTGGAKFGSLASSIFAFQDQVDSLLDQELDLLRGRDDKATTVKAPPVYNRLYWNFTGGNGEVAYVQTFNVTDVNGDGFIDASDSKIMFPQGHGDAWGHYLTGLTVYYDLLRNTNFNWVARPEAVSLGGIAVQVNYKDERKFAHAAAAKAQTGADIMNLTYRSAYVDNPNGQYQGYKDTDTTRAWGLTEWGRRSGQGAYLDWVTVNAVLPAVDQDPTHTGLAKVDRVTVSDIATIPAAAAAVQQQLDQADAGLNPLGLAKQAVPFDIDPTLVAAGQTHFEQIYGRAVSAMVNASAVWDQANSFTSALRQQQDTESQFAQNIAKQDQDFQNRLIEVFGYPYAGDIGAPGAAFPTGYTGPDIYHYMYFDTSSFDTNVAQPSAALTAYFTKMPGAGQYFPADLPATYTQTTNILAINFPLADSLHRFQPPVSWGSRRAPGEIQMAISDMLQSQARMQQAIARYDALIVQIQDAATLLQDAYGLNATNTLISNTADQTITNLQNSIVEDQSTVAQLNFSQTTVAGVASAIETAMPAVVGLADDCCFAARGVVAGIAVAAEACLGFAAIGVQHGIASEQEAAAAAADQANSQISANNVNYQLQQQLFALRDLLQQEPAARLECFTLRETVAQNLGRYQAALAKGQRILEQRATFAKQAAAQTQSARYQDMTFRIFQNDAIQKYKAQFALAQRYVYLAAIAYDFETELLGTASGSGQQFLTDIIRQQSLGEMNGSTPVNGVAGLADPLARMGQNFAVLKGQLGFNNPQTETGKFSLRYGLFRQQTGFTNALAINGVFTNDWKTELQNHIVPDLWQVPEFRRYCRPFAPESAGPQPGLVVRFGTTVTFGLNFFGWPLSGGDSAYDPTLFATKVRSAGTWFAGYDRSGLSLTPRIYLIPVGADVMRAPSDTTLAAREWRVVDQVLPVPFPLGASTLASASYIPMNDSLSGTMGNIRQFSSFLAYVDQGNTVDPSQVTTSSRLIGRSVWNTEWMLIVPGGTLLSDPNQGLNAFINSVSDIKIFFQTYSYSGN